MIWAENVKYIEKYKISLNNSTESNICQTYWLTDSYSIIFWGNSARSINIFKLQKRIVRIITNSRNRVSFRHLFKKLNILQFYSQYLLLLLIFVIDNISLFKTNSELYIFFLFESPFICKLYRYIQQMVENY
jgi:hypothetical protein